MSVISLIKALLGGRNKPKKNESILHSPARTVANMLKHISISCSCGDISVPIEAKGEIYRCILCNKEQVHRSYHLNRHTSLSSPLSQQQKPFIDMDFYDDAIILLKNDKKEHLTLKHRRYRLKH